MKIFLIGSKQTLNGDLPKLPQGMESQKIEAISTGYALEADELEKNSTVPNPMQINLL